MTKLPRQRFHLMFSLCMAALMVFLVTFVVTLVNVGMPPDFLSRWARSFASAYCVAAPTLYFFAPRVRQLVARFVEMP